MLVIPKEKPVYSNLSTYFLDTGKFLHHCKKEYGAGCITIDASSNCKGVIFFDADKTITAVSVDRGGKEGLDQEALNILLRVAREQDVRVSLYKINASLIQNWVKLHVHEPLVSEATTQGTLEDVIKKMSSQQLTGYIDITLGDEAAILIFKEGQVAGGSFSWSDSVQEIDQHNFELLINKSAQQIGVFKIFGNIATPEKLFDESLNHRGETVEKAASPIIATLEELLDIFERVVQADVEIDEKFNILLKNKFIEKANKFSFLDPFADEFLYTDQRIVFSGKASDQELTEGLIECVRELADELGVLQALKQEIVNWSTYIGKDILEISGRYL